MAIKPTKLTYYYEFFEPKIQYRNSGIILYEQYIGKKKINPKLDTRFFEKPTNTYKGDITLSAKKRLKKSIDILLQISAPHKVKHPITKKLYNHQLSVITLTIPDDTLIHPTKAHKQLLEPFIKWMRDTQEVKHYIWKLEWQKRGQLHYHITLPNVIHYKQIRDKWNYYLTKSELNKNYYNEHGHYDANSTDIHKVWKIKCLQSYLEKEFIKSCQNINPNKEKYSPDEINLKYKSWDCSLSLKSQKLYTTYFDNKHNDAIDNFYYENAPELTYNQTPHCEIIQFNKKSIHKIIPTYDRENYNNYLNQIKNYVRQKPNVRSKATKKSVQ